MPLTFAHIHGIINGIGLGIIIGIGIYHLYQNRKSKFYKLAESMFEKK